MAIAASDIAGLFPQPRPGVAARFARRFGGAVRIVVANGVSLAVSLRRPAAPRSPSAPQATRDLAPQIPPSAPRAPCLPHAAAPVSPSLPAGPALLPRLLAGKRRRRALRGRLRLPSSDNPFTAENCPGLSPEMCAFLNTPMEDCDPEMLRMLFTAFEDYVVGLMPPEAAETIHAVIWGRLRGVLDDPGPNGPPDEAPEPVSILSMDVMPATAMETAPNAPADTAPNASTHAALVALTDAAPAAAPDAPPDAPRDAMPPAAEDEHTNAPLLSAPALPEGLLAVFVTAWRDIQPASPDLLREAQAATLADSVNVAVIARSGDRAKRRRPGAAGLAPQSIILAVENISFPPRPIAFSSRPPDLGLLVQLFRPKFARRMAMSAVAAAAVLRR